MTPRAEPSVLKSGSRIGGCQPRLKGAEPFPLREQRMYHRTIVMLAACAAVAGAQPNLVTNGTFEATPVTSGTHLTFGPGRPDITTPGTFGWTVTGHSVDVHCWTCAGWVNTPDGNQSLELNGDSTAGIWQDLQTTAGQQYTLRFLATRWNDWPFAIRWNGTTLYSGATINSSNAAASTFGWGWYEFTFANLLATAGTTRLEFISQQPSGAHGVVIDNVRVFAAVPEPSTPVLCAAGLVALAATARWRSAARCQHSRSHDRSPRHPAGR
jgi:hypothetical protein